MGRAFACPHRRNSGKLRPLFIFLTGQLHAMKRIFPFALVLTSIHSANLWAETNSAYGLCPPPPQPRVSTQILAGEETHIRADEVKGTPNDTLEFSGHVELENREQWIAADRITVTNNPRYVIAEDNIQAGTDGLLVSGESASYNQEENRIEFNNVRYQYPERRLFGNAEEIHQQNNQVEMKRASYTTCPSDDPAWSLQASKIKLDQEEDVGILHHATLRLEDIPVFYIPWASFPISDKRKSGLLYPHLGTTEDGGIEIGVPYYWNIAPNYDNTLMPIWIEQRGTLWDDEFRFLIGQTEGSLRARYMDNDRTNQLDRHLVRAKVTSRITDRWRATLDGTKVSDNAWFDDFSNDLNLTSLNHLSQRLDLDYYSRHAHFRARLLDYQTLNSSIAATDEPYRQLPRLTYDARYPLPIKNLDFSLDSEMVRFDHDINQTGSRFDLNPRLSWNWRAPSGYINPSFQWRFTHYELSSGNDFTETSINRKLSTFSVDSGLFFERSMESGDIQTLEPRLFYVKTPRKDQSDIPVFDTSESSFNFYSLFRENHFNGIDRIADADQLTLALTTRKIEKESGHIPWRASLGQVLYFEDREVTLPDTAIDTESNSSYAIEVGFDPQGPWAGSASLLFDNKFEHNETATLLGRYRGTNGKILNLEYRYRQDDIEQSNISFAWPFHRHWSVMGRWLNSIEDSQNIETVVGLEYNTCCWKTQVVARRYAPDADTDYNDSIYLQLVLKGLSSQGSATDLLENSITGYKSNDE